MNAKDYAAAMLVFVFVCFSTFSAESQESKDEEFKEGIITLRVQGPDGEPAAGVQIYKYYRDYNGMSPKGLFESDSDGIAKIHSTSIFRYEYERNNGIVLYALLDRELCGFLKVSGEDTGKELIFKVEPVCRLRGKVKSTELKKLGKAFRGGHVYLYTDGSRALSSYAGGGNFMFLVPPGQYKLSAYGGYVYSSRRDLEIEKGQKNMEVNFDLEADKLTKLEGKPAPELCKIKGWINSEGLKLSDLRGKYVVLDFWGYWCGPCRAGMPKLLDIYEEFKDNGLLVIGVHDDSLKNIKELKKKLEEISKKYCKGREITFPIALDGGGRSKIKGTERTSRGATTAAYGIQAWPTGVLIDKEGKVAGRFHFRSPDAKKKMREILGIENLEDKLRKSMQD